MPTRADTNQPTTLSIRLDASSDPISGLLVSGSERREFSGWIELVGLIESLREAAAPQLSSPREKYRGYVQGYSAQAVTTEKQIIVAPRSLPTASTPPSSTR